jgi:hypothetical protein
MLRTSSNEGRPFMTCTVVIRAAVAAALAVAASAAGVLEAHASGPPVAATAHAQSSPAGSLSPIIDNPYFPLVPGTTEVYRGVRDGEQQVDRVTALKKTKVVDGVTTRVVRDVARHGSRLLEKTFDWYAQDEAGTVWYYGENTKDYDRQGNVKSTEGSWTAGVHGARPGIIMEAHPHVSDGYRQEYYAGHAEDMAWILSIGTSLTVSYGRVHDVLRTMEWSRLEPKVVDEKYYAPGLGIVDEVTVAGGQETSQLVRVVHG